jgi:hypothetical protein
MPPSAHADRRRKTHAGIQRRRDRSTGEWLIVTEGKVTVCDSGGSWLRAEVSIRLGLAHQIQIKGEKYTYIYIYISIYKYIARHGLMEWGPTWLTAVSRSRRELRHCACEMRPCSVLRLPWS